MTSSTCVWVQVAVALGLLVLLVTLAPLPLSADDQRGVVIAKQEAMLPVVLDIALVNEDRGASFNGQDLNLESSCFTIESCAHQAAW